MRGKEIKGIQGERWSLESKERQNFKKVSGSKICGEVKKVGDQMFYYQLEGLYSFRQLQLE